MQEWWMSMDIFMKGLWCISLTASIIFIIQTIMTFIGMDSDAGASADFDGSSADGEFPFQLFTFRNFVNFFLGFGWTAIALNDSIEARWAVMLISIAVGLLLVAIVMYIFFLMSRMEQSGNIDIQDAAGCKGNVYLKIPGHKSGEGKVQITIQEAVREYNAITEGDELPTGTPIRVTQVVNEDTLLVERF